MTLLVTGAMGHVGYELVRQAAKKGMAILALYRGGFHKPETLDAGSNVRWLQCDLNDPSAVANLAQYPIEACIHAAAISNEAYARPNPLNAINTNIGATANLLDAARVNNWRRFILVSTGSVFQNRADTTTPILEETTPCPGNIYSTTKASAEMMTRMYRTEFNLSASAVRVSWVSGPPIVTDSPARGPIPSYLIRALRGEAIREVGGDFAASFTFVVDVANGLIAAASAQNLRHDIYHLGHGVNFTARQVADAVRKACPDVRIELGQGTEPWTKFTAMRGPLAGTRFQDDTGFAPSHSLEAGVRAYAEWLRAHSGHWPAPEGSPVTL